MKAATSLPMMRCCIFFWWTLAVLGSAQNSNDVLEAINICRDKLKEDPHFPKIQHSLAQLLDSQIAASEDVDTALVTEVLQLYHKVGQPPSEVIEKRLPPARVRFESLVRAGTIARDILRDMPRAIEYYSVAISNIDGIEESSLLLAAFESIMPMLLMQFDQRMELAVMPDGAVEGQNQHKYAQLAFDLCDRVEAKCPTETIADEYRGAVLRRMKQPENAYHSFLRAMEKAQQNMNSEVDNTDQMSNEHISLVANFVKTSILAAAAGREAGDSFQEQMSYLREAENASAPLLASLQANDGLKDPFRDQMVDLYNNMGIAEKKQGSKKRARDFFKDALQIYPNDGHALAQLASVDDGSNPIVSNVRELDAEYVRGLFDGYSSRFETELVDVLQYKGHFLVHDALQQALKRLKRSPASIKRVVDLGCGTGLTGELVANEMPWVEVSGVDLSQRMVEISRDRKSNRGRSVYASVSNEDGAQYLSTLEAQSVDCILASDVFIYIGDISKVLEESSKCLVEGGLIIFTVEGYDGPGLQLLSSGRFGHSRAYIAEEANSAGFEVWSWDDCVLRQQAKLDVKGATVVLRKME